MKKLVVAVALVASLATPVFAQSFNPDFGTGNVLASRTQQDPGMTAYAQAPATSRWTRTHGGQAMSNVTDPGFRSQQAPEVDENY
jgi:hypothetical protein